MIAKLKRMERKGSGEEFFFKFIFSILIALLIGFLIISDFKISKRREELNEKLASLKKESEALEEKNKTLESRISQTGKESYWEQKIREQGYVRSGENPVVIVSPKEEKVKGEKETEAPGSEGIITWIKDRFAGLVERFNATFPR